VKPEDIAQRHSVQVPRFWKNCSAFKQDFEGSLQTILSLMASSEQSKANYDLKSELSIVAYSSQNRTLSEEVRISGTSMTC